MNFPDPEKLRAMRAKAQECAEHEASTTSPAKGRTAVPISLRSDPPSLQSAGYRQALDHRFARHGELEVGARTIDRLGELYRSLKAVRANEDPRETFEQRALSFRTSLDKALEVADRITSVQKRMLDDLRERAFQDARKATGIDTAPASAGEIRSALRAMSPEDRTKAIGDAIAAGDAAVVSSVVNAGSPILVGETTMPIDRLVSMFLDNNHPELRQTLDDITTAERFIGLAVNEFLAETTNLRDAAAEKRGLEGGRAADAAKQRLQAALDGYSDDEEGGSDVD